jgi:hypothetical protein
MTRIFILLVILLTITSGVGINGNNSGHSEPVPSFLLPQDTLQKLQVVYNGILWKNKYRRIKEDQFLFSNFFLPATVFVNGRTYRNLRIKFDIYSDELITPLNREEIIQLNKEMVDSFAISYEDKLYKFINITDDTVKNITGYVNELYKGKSALYVKYSKGISPSATPLYDGEFSQTHHIYLVRESIGYPIKRTNDLFNILNEDKVQIKNFIKQNKLRLSNKNPESYIPVIRYYDSIRH